MSINQGKRPFRQAFGFTLLEMLLVLAISSTLVALMLNYTTQKSDEMRREKVVMQIEQIMNGALAYYVNNSTWPLTYTSGVCGVTDGLNASVLVTQNYLPLQGNFNNTYGYPYEFSCTLAPSGTFFVATEVNTPTNAAIIAGRLPIAFVTDKNGALGTSNAPTQTGGTSGTGCGSSTPLSSCTWVVASVTVPGQNLNNARSINFAGTFSPSACVPAPNCPSGMSPTILVVPTAVQGVQQAPTCASAPTNPYDPASSNCSAPVYPIESFTAYAVGGTGANAGLPQLAQSVVDCEIYGTPTVMPCLSSNTGAAGANSGMTGATIPTSDNTKYWRICLSIYTQQGPVVVNTNSPSGISAIWGKMTGALTAFTRCVPNNGAETPGGSGYNVWQNNSNLSS